MATSEQPQPPLDDRTSWLEERRKGIGGSDAPAILGIDPFRGPMAVWLDKTGQLPDTTAGEPALWGKLLEDPIANEFERRTGKWVLDRQRMAKHPLIPWMRATLDGEVYLDKGGPVQGIYEGKTASGRSQEWADGVPDHVKVQCQHNMYVAGLSRAWVACLVMAPAVELRIWEIERDEDTLSFLVEEETKFWKLVQDGTPPPADGSWGSLEALRKVYPQSAKRTVELGSHGMELIHRREKFWQMEKEAKNRKYAIDAEIMMLLGDAEDGLVDGKTAVTWRSQSRTTIDPELVRNNHPDIVESVSTKTTLRALRFKTIDRRDYERVE